MKYEKGSFITVPSRDRLRGKHPTAQALYMWLSAYANETGDCFPSRTRLAKDCGCSEKMIDKMLDSLIKLGLVKYEKRIEGNKNLTNLYTVIVWEGGAQDAPGGAHSSPGVGHDVRKELKPVLTKPTYTAQARPKFEVEYITITSEEDSGDSKSPRISGDKRKAYDELIAWSEKERGFKFLKTHRMKQYKAFKIANENGINRSQLIERWEDMAGEKFWIENGFDWMNVVTSFNTKSV